MVGCLGRQIRSQSNDTNTQSFTCRVSWAGDGEGAGAALHKSPWWEGQAPEFSEFDSTSSWALLHAVCPCAQRPKHTGVTDILGIVDGLCSCLSCGRHVLPCYMPCSHCCSDPLCDGACWRRKLSTGLSMQTLLLAPHVASAVWAQWLWNVMGEEAESQEIKNQIQSHAES